MGYKILKVNISNGKHDVFEIPDSWRSKLIGGKGFGIKLLLDMLPRFENDPYSPDNPLIFMTGPLTGTAAPSMRSCVVSKSPLTGTFCDSYFGGHFGQELRYAGYEGLILSGCSENPIYILIQDEMVEIRDGKHLWGLETGKVYQKVKEDLGDETWKIACIGPAGERLVRFSLIDCEYHRQAGRGGLGAVMGSKKIKAIAIRGTKGIPIFDRTQFLEGVWEAYRGLKYSEATKALTMGGTIEACLEFSNSLGLLPVRNYTDGVLEEEIFEKIKVDKHKQRLWVRDNACAGCPIRCSKMGKISRGKQRGMICDNIEYETLGLLGANLAWGDIEGIAYANLRCDELGLDTISTGGVIGFAIEAHKKGILKSKELNDLKLDFGNGSAILFLVEAIGKREGIGDFLAEGTKRVAKNLGPQSELFAVNVKGLETPAWGPRGSVGMGLAYMTGDRGGCHERAFPIGWESTGISPEGNKIESLSYEGKAELVAWEQDLWAANYSLVACEFGRTGITTNTYRKMLAGATGIDLSERDYLRVGERIWNMIRLFNLKQGITRDEDHLPPRFKEPLPNGPFQGHCFNESQQKSLLNSYYQIRGWDNEGRPNLEKIEELSISALDRMDI